MRPYKRLDQLSFPRFLAAMTVILFHGGRELFPFNRFPITPLFITGPVSVSFFFVLSGFVLSLGYYQPGHRFDMRFYLGARFARVYPVYLLSLLLICLYYSDIIAEIKPVEILADILMVQAWIPKYALSLNFPAWALSVEVSFYLLFPFLTAWAYRQPLRRLIWISIGFWAFSQLLHFSLMGILMPEGEDFLYYNPLLHLNSFLVGMVGGIWLRNLPETPVNKWLNLGLLGGSLAATGLLLIVGAALAENEAVNVHLAAGLFAPFFLLILLTLALDATPLSKALSQPWLALLGDASYSLYILHIPVRWLYERIAAITGGGISYPLLYYTYLPMVIAIAVIVFLVIERPARQRLRGLVAKGLFSPVLLFGDVLIVVASVSLSFVVRLGPDAAASTYYSAARFMALAALIVRVILFFSFRLYGPAWSGQSMLHAGRRMLLAVTSGSVVIAAFMLGAQATGLLRGFPRSALLTDWGITLLLAFLMRMIICANFARR